MTDLKPELKLVGVGWLTFHRVRRVVRDFTFFVISLYCGFWWLQNADWHHPVGIQKHLIARFVHFLKDVVWPYLATPMDWILSITFVVIPFLILIGILGSFIDLLWSLFSFRASRRYRKAF